MRYIVSAIMQRLYAIAKRTPSPHWLVRFCVDWSPSFAQVRGYDDAQSGCIDLAINNPNYHAGVSTFQWAVDMADYLGAVQAFIKEELSD